MRSSKRKVRHPKPHRKQAGGGFSEILDSTKDFFKPNSEGISEQDKNAKHMNYIFAAMIFGAIFFIVTTLLMNIWAMRKIHIGMKVGDRSCDECGEFFMEVESGRYLGYMAFNKNKNLLHYASLCIQFGLTFLVVIAAVFITTLRYNSCDFVGINQSEEPLCWKRVDSWVRYTAMIVAVLSPIAFLVSYAKLTKNPTTYDPNTHQKQMLALGLINSPILIIAGLLIFMFIKGRNRDRVGVFGITWFIILIVFMIFNVLYKLDLNKLFKTYNNNYNTILLGELKTVADALKSTLSAPGKDMLLEVIRKNYGLAGNNGGISLDASDWHLYIMHAGGRELDDIMQALVPEAIQRGLDSAVDTTNKNVKEVQDIAKAIGDVRTKMREIREYKEYQSVTSKAIFHASILAFLVVAARLFFLYHVSYVKAADFTIIVFSAWTLAAIIWATVYGWFASAMTF